MCDYYRECPDCGKPMSKHDDSRGTITYICHNCGNTETENYEVEDK